MSRTLRFVAVGLLSYALLAPASTSASIERTRSTPQVTPNAITDGPTVLFVHGWKAPADENIVFTELLEPLDEAFLNRVELFDYYQDASFDDEGTCVGVQAEPSPNPTAGMPAPGRPGTTYCDSQSDLAYNVVLLKERVQDLYDVSEGQPVVLIGNSLGAAIIRGLLSYSSDLDDGVAATKVDSVVFLEGAVDGSNLARMATNYGPVLCLLKPLECGLVVDAATPAVFDFAAQSDWYQWANPGEERLPEIPIFNAFGDIRPQLCFLWTDNCAPAGDSVGDGLLPPGTDDPFDVPDGGARFLAGAPAPQNWQWPLDKTVKTSDAEGIPTSPYEFVAGQELHPAFHGNFETNMDVLAVTDCADWENPTEISLLDQISRIVIGRMDGEPYDCQPEPQT